VEQSAQFERYFATDPLSSLGLDSPRGESNFLSRSCEDANAARRVNLLCKSCVVTSFCKWAAQFAEAACSVSRISLSSASSMEFSPGLPIHLCRIVPLRSMMKKVGVAGMFHCRLRAPSSSRDRQLMLCSFIVSLSSPGSWNQELTPINAKGLSFSFVTSDRSCGQVVRQVSQNSLQK
jgi:hypothetical protein